MKAWYRVLTAGVAVVMAMTGTAMAESGDAETRLEEARQELLNAAYEQDLSGDPNHDFVNLLIAHQKAGIDLAQAVLDVSEDERLRGVANRLVENQQDELDNLRTWLERFDDPSPGSDAEAIREAYQSMLDGMAENREDVTSAEGPQRTFVNTMIWHHQMAMSLGQVLLSNSVDAQLRILANDIVRESNRNIAELQNWLRSIEMAE